MTSAGEWSVLLNAGRDRCTAFPNAVPGADGTRLQNPPWSQTLSRNRLTESGADSVFGYTHLEELSPGMCSVLSERWGLGQDYSCAPLGLMMTHRMWLWFTDLVQELWLACWPSVGGGGRQAGISWSRCQSSQVQRQTSLLRTLALGNKLLFGKEFLFLK